MIVEITEDNGISSASLEWRVVRAALVNGRIVIHVHCIDVSTLIHEQFGYFQLSGP